MCFEWFGVVILICVVEVSIVIVDLWFESFKVCFDFWGVYVDWYISWVVVVVFGCELDVVMWEEVFGENLRYVWLG